MGFRIRNLKGTFVLVLLWGSMALGSSGGRKVTVLVNDSAQVPVAVLRQAEQETARIFALAGIDIAWVNCEAVIGEYRCREAPGTNQFVLHIVPTGKTSSDLVFGVAFLAEDGSGKYCNVFFDRIREAHGDLGASTAQLLGTVAAHELGHLLLGSHAHSNWGIMEPVWKEEALRQAGMGTFLFTAEQGGLMRARIENDGTVLAGLAER